MNIASQKFFRLDPKCFKAFVAVAEYGHFTLAAEKAAMTQSSVSQHVAKLEDQLGHPLFKRTPKNILLTEAGEKLLTYIQWMNDSTAEFFDEINKGQEAIEGIVRYSMPPSCLLSPHFPMLLERRLEYPGLELRVELYPNEEVLENVINGRFDFGFVTEKVQHISLTYQSFCQEEYILVSSNAAQLAELDSENLVEQKFIGYPGMDTYFNFWVRHFMTGMVDIDARSLYHAGDINSIDGAIKMVAGGLGISVFPRHCVQQFIDSGALQEYQRGEAQPLLNDIYIVKLNTFTQPKRVEKVIEWFMDMVH